MRTRPYASALSTRSHRPTMCTPQQGTGRLVSSTARPTHCEQPRQRSTTASKLTSTLGSRLSGCTSPHCSPRRTERSAWSPSSRRVQAKPSSPGVDVSNAASGDGAVDAIKAAWDDPKLANVLYHDWEASTYDAKWSISYDERCISYARGRFRHVAGDSGWPYARALELGCGTGFIQRNLKQACVLDEGHVTDISPGMVKAAKHNAQALGFDVVDRVADADTIPCVDNTF